MQLMGRSGIFRRQVEKCMDLKRAGKRFTRSAIRRYGGVDRLIRSSPGESGQNTQGHIIYDSL